jgi:hypothetical protein
MKILDRFARAWLLRKGAEWQKQTCETCRAFGYWSWPNGYEDPKCWKWQREKLQGDDRACPAWQQKENTQ